MVLDGMTGQVIWQTQLAEPVHFSVAMGPQAIYAATGQHIYAVWPVNGPIRL